MSISGSAREMTGRPGMPTSISWKSLLAENIDYERAVDAVYQVLHNDASRPWDYLKKVPAIIIRGCLYLSVQGTCWNIILGGQR